MEKASPYREEISEKNNPYEKIIKEARERGKWVREGFDLEKSLKNITKPFIEIGGPTAEGYDLVDLKKLNKKILESNLFPGSPVFTGLHGKSSDTINYCGKVNFIADATEMPLQNDSVGAIFASYFGGSHCKDTALNLKDKKFKNSAYSRHYPPSETERQQGIAIPPLEFTLEQKMNEIQQRKILRAAAMKEAWRVLEPGGLMIWQGGDENDFNYAAKNGFGVLLISSPNDPANPHDKNIYYSQVYKKIVLEGYKENF